MEKLKRRPLSLSTILGSQQGHTLNESHTSLRPPDSSNLAEYAGAQQKGLGPLRREHILGNGQCPAHVVQAHAALRFQQAVQLRGTSGHGRACKECYAGEATRIKPGGTGKSVGQGAQRRGNPDEHAQVF